jgi:hypothetical protein
VFTDTLYEAQLWVYDQIHVQEVWRSGISKLRIQYGPLPTGETN